MTGGQVDGRRSSPITSGAAVTSTDPARAASLFFRELLESGTRCWRESPTPIGKALQQAQLSSVVARGSLDNRRPCCEEASGNRQESPSGVAPAALRRSAPGLGPIALAAPTPTRTYASRAIHPATVRALFISRIQTPGTAHVFNIFCQFFRPCIKLRAESSAFLSDPSPPIVSWTPVNYYSGARRPGVASVEALQGASVSGPRHPGWRPSS